MTLSNGTPAKEKSLLLSQIALAILILTNTLIVGISYGSIKAKIEAVVDRISLNESRISRLEEAIMIPRVK